MAAVDHRHKATALALLKAGAKASHQDAGTLQTALLLACDQEDVELVKRLVKADAPVDARDSTGTSPLQLCAGRNLLSLVRVLLDAKANPNLRNHQRGLSPLASAAAGGHTKVCELLLERGAELESTDHNDATPLWHALQGNFSSTAQLLLKRGAFVFEDAKAKTPAVNRLLESHRDDQALARLDEMSQCDETDVEAALRQAIKFRPAPRLAWVALQPGLLRALISLYQAKKSKRARELIALLCRHATALGVTRDYVNHSEAELVSTAVALAMGDSKLEAAVLKKLVPLWVPASLAYNLACLFAKRAGQRELALYFVNMAAAAGKPAESFLNDADFASLAADPDFLAVLEAPNDQLASGGPLNPYLSR